MPSLVRCLSRCCRLVLEFDKMRKSQIPLVEPRKPAVEATKVEKVVNEQAGEDAEIP